MASGLDATIGSGFANKASGNYTAVGGGIHNAASGSFATVPGGWYGAASHYGELAYASGPFAVVGDAQTSLYVLRRETGDDVLIVAAHRYSGGSSASYQVAGVIRNIGGATAFVGTPIKTVLGENNAAWDVQVEADDALDALVVKVQGSSGTTIRWVASVRTVKLAR